jgi:hypothetical protein
MDELELRVAAIETALIEVFAWLPHDALQDAQRSIRGGLTADITGDEKAIRQGAWQLIEDARKRWTGHQHLLP